MTLSRSPLALLCVFPLLLTITALSDASHPLAQYDIVAENDFLTLYLNRQTTEIAVQEKASDHVWYSNPGTRTTQGQVTIQYYTPMDIFRAMDSHNDAVAYEQFWITELEDGVRIEYLLGEEWKQSDFIPIMITQQRLEELVLSQVTDREQTFVNRQYHLIELVPTPADYEPLTIPGIGPESVIFGDYTLVSPNQELSVRERQSLINVLLTKMNENKEGRDRTTPWSFFRQDEFTMLRNTPTYLQIAAPRSWDTDDLYELLIRAGYTPEHKVEDHLYFNLVPPVRNIELFAIPLEYRLDDEWLVARVPMEDVLYTHKADPGRIVFGARGVHLQISGEAGRRGRIADIFGRVGGELVTFPLHTVSFLHFFGAAGATEQGYMFIPDGSGALIELNNPLSANLTYAQPVYGRDESLPPAAQETLERGVKQVHLPVFGVQSGDTAFLAVIEDGESLATIRAAAASQARPFNLISAEFLVQPSATATLMTGSNVGGGRAMNIYPDDIYRGDLVIRYTFLTDEAANYVGMATRYREYLEQYQGLSRIEDEDSIPFYLELIGAIADRSLILGVPRTVPIPMTTFDQALEICGELLESGIDNLQLRYLGWSQGGVEHDYPSQVLVEPSLGSTADWHRLRDVLAKKGVGFYPDISLMQVYSEAHPGAFRERVDASRTIDGKIVSTMQGPLLSPARLTALVPSFVANYSAHGLSGLSLRDLGSSVHSDFRDDAGFLPRQEALAIIRGQIEYIHQAGIEPLFPQANSYAWPYTSHMVQMPLSDSGHNITSHSVPFLQIAAHGSINYAGEPINLADNFRRSVLQLMETGARPYFTWSYSDSSRTKDTRFNHLYAVHYRYWLDQAIGLYHELNSVLAPVIGQRIIGHSRLLPNVTETIYEDGTTIIVNYSKNPVTVNGRTVPAEDYISFQQ